MPRETPPPLSLTLTTLRTLRGWSQKELALAAGTAPSVLSAYETGIKPLSREKLDALTSLLGLGPFAVEGMLDFIALTRGTAEQEEIGAMALLAARTAAEAVRSELPRVLRELQAARDRRQAEALWDRLRRHTGRERRMIVEVGSAYQSWAFCERLCAESEKAAAADAGRAMDLAELALFTAGLVPGEESWRQRLQGYAWGHLGNARRVANDLPGADDAFARARKLWEAGAPGDPGLLDVGRLLDLEASLRRDQRRLPEALDLLDQALATDRTGKAAGRILLKKAFAFEQMGDQERAIAALEQAALLIDGQSEPRLLCVLRFNLAVNLCHLGRHKEAEALLTEMRELAMRLGNDLDLVRALWLKGRIAAGLDRKEEALAALEQVRREFMSRGLYHDLALTSLDLAVLHLQEDRTAEVKTLVRQMAPVFRAQGVHREVLAALRLFCEAVEREAATVELARRVIDYLERARYDPELRFEG
jgi:tetratricopeptide (TPR) repeat protein